MGSWFSKIQREINSESILDEILHVDLFKILEGVLCSKISIDLLKQKLVCLMVKTNVFIAANPQIVYGCIGIGAIAMGIIIWECLGEKKRNAIEYKIRTTIHEAINIGKMTAIAAWDMVLDKLSYLKLPINLIQFIARMVMSKKSIIATTENELNEAITQISKEVVRNNNLDYDFSPIDRGNLNHLMHSNMKFINDLGVSYEKGLKIFYKFLIDSIKTVIATKKQISIESINPNFHQETKAKIEKFYSDNKINNNLIDNNINNVVKLWVQK